jgi:hypothetical protein
MAKRQTIQWPKDKQYNGQKTENTMTKGPDNIMTKRHNTMAKRQTIQLSKDRQYNGQKTDTTMAKRKRTNNDVQNTIQKT